jgi:hypothetical protein
MEFGCSKMLPHRSGVLEGAGQIYPRSWLTKISARARQLDTFPATICSITPFPLFPTPLLAQLGNKNIVIGIQSGLKIEEFDRGYHSSSEHHNICRTITHEMVESLFYRRNIYFTGIDVGIKRRLLGLHSNCNLAVAKKSKSCSAAIKGLLST